jgi:hypothetical protein
MRTLLFLGVLGWFGCAEPPFSVHAQDNELATLQPTVARLRTAAPAGVPAPRNGSGHGMVYVFAGPERRGDKDLSAAEKTLYGFDLSDGKLAFAVPADVRSRFVVTNGLLVHREGESELALRDAQSGALRARVSLPAGETLAGLTADGNRVFYVSRAPEDKNAPSQRKSYVTAVSETGEQKWRVMAPGSVGAPAAMAGLLALPYRYQEVVILDANNGEELTRIREKDEQIGFVRSSAQGFYYGVGDKGVALLTDSSLKAEKNQIAYAEPKLGERVRTFLNWEGYRAEQSNFSAFDRNRLLWEGQMQGDKLGFRDGQAVLHSYRFFFGVNTDGGSVRWAYAQPRHNVMASDLSEQAVLFVAQDGEIGALDRKSGARLLSEHIELKPGQQVIGATFDAPAFAPESHAAPQPTAPLLESLHGIIFDKDSSFLSVKLFAVQALGSLPSESSGMSKEATAELLHIVTAEGLPPQLARAAGDVLTAHHDRQAAPQLIAALQQGYDFLEDRRPRGLDILARIAAAIGATETEPALAERLLDPSTPPGAMKELVSALVQIGGANSGAPNSHRGAQALRDLLLLYRSDPAFLNDPMALKQAGEGLLKLDGEPGRRTVMFVALEPRTLAPLGAYFRKMLDDTTPSLTKVAADLPKTRPRPNVPDVPNVLAGQAIPDAHN